jgi:hypothetical protein
VPVAAAVNRPCASTVMFAVVYEPATTAVSANFAAVTASSAIFAVVTASSAIFAVVIALRRDPHLSVVRQQMFC